MDERRPTPEELLIRARLDEPATGRGRLKIYFGAAPGVGKTYAMLEAAQARSRQGTDVVIGWVETHGRAETERLAEGLERLPPRVIEYRGMKLREFDIDAAVARRPELLIVDELPHTNAPGARHARRWQDVEELLDAGINVETTLNIQHVESVVDIVAVLTGVDVRETVPDRLLERADEIELVDLPPEDLLQRLREGKVYVPAQASRAMENFFRPLNLTALRELALRRTADRISAQRFEIPAAGAVSEESLLVVVGTHPESARLIRTAYRIASRWRAHWIAMAVETPVFERSSAAERERLNTHLALAQQLGAETLVVRGEQVAVEILNVARERRISRVIVGRPVRPSLRERVAGSLAEKLVRAGVIDVMVVPDREEPVRAPLHLPGRPRSTPGQYGRAAAVIGLVTLLCWSTRQFFTLADQAMIYLLGILLVAGTLRRGPSLLAALLSVAALNFFFVTPYFTFDVSSPRYVVTFIVLFVTAFLVSRQTLLIREQADAARERERRTVTLYLMTRQFAAARTEEDIRASVTRHVRELLGRDAALLLLDENGRLEPGPDAPELPDRELTVARWVLEHGDPAGFGTDTLPEGPWTLLPVGQFPPIGVFGLCAGTEKGALSPSERQILETAVGQAAAALERIRSARKAEALRLGIETERARNTLLSLVSHDLRTPLSSIGGAADTLLSEGGRLGGDERRGLLESIRDETTRLSRLIGDMLEITRLQSGALALRRERYPLEELIESALDQMEAGLRGRDVQVKLPEEMVFVEADGTVLTRVFVNLLDNVVKHTPARTPVEIEAVTEGDRVKIQIADRGPGIAAGDEERVFEMFQRGAGSRVQGTGLGLALSAAIVHAHGGEIRAGNRPGGGAVFIVELPRTTTPLAVPGIEGVPV